MDNVLEEIRLGMEVNDPRMNQQRLSTVKFLGELYNYTLFEASVIFRTLYMFLNFGFSITAESKNIIKICSLLSPVL